MKLFKLLAVTALAVCSSSLVAQAALADELQIYATSDSVIAKTKPPGAAPSDWAAQAAGAPITIAPGATVFIACLNTADSAKHKYFRIELSAPAGGLLGLNVASASGFSGDDDSSPVAMRQNFSDNHSNLLVREYRFTPQPAWERVAFSNPTNNGAIVATVTAVSVCADTRPDMLMPQALTLVAGSVGSATPGAMYGTPRFTSIWIFPVSNPVDPNAAQPFSAPVATGAWQKSVVYQTPFGTARPRGGVLWGTLGAGLQPDQNFSLVLSMMNAPADSVYELYLRDASSQQTLQLSLDLTSLEPITYCTAKVNSLGCTPAIASQGMPSASQQGGFLVSCARVRNNKPGVMLYSVQGRASNAFQGGLLCVQAPIRRSIGLSSGGNPGPANDCSGVFMIDMNAFAAGLLGGTPAPELRQPGRAIDCQWWSRDPQAQFGSSLSNALEYVIGN